MITTPVDIVDDDEQEFSCVVETRTTSVGDMPITDREIIWSDREPENREDVERKILRGGGDHSKQPPVTWRTFRK